VSSLANGGQWTATASGTIVRDQTATIDLHLLAPTPPAMTFR